MPETILVTGATGTVGRRVVAQLLKDGGDKVSVHAGVHTLSKGQALADAGAHLVELDFDNSGSIEQAVAGVDRIFLLIPGFNSTPQANTVISAALASRVKSIVRLSVIGAEDEPGITITRLHRSVELAIMGSELDWTFLRPSNFMQNFEAMAATIKSQGAIYMPVGDALISYIDAADIAKVASAVLLDTTNRHSGQAYVLTGPEAIRLDAVGEIFSRVLEREIKGVAVSDDAAAEALTQQGMPPIVVQALGELFQWIRTGTETEVSTAVQTILGHRGNTLERYVADNRAIYE